MTTTENHPFEIGKTYVFFVPPGWILAGTVGRITPTHVILSVGTYIEISEQGVSPIADLTRATTTAQVNKIVKQSYQLGENTALLLEGILISTLCASDLSSLTRSADAATIRGAK